MDHTGQLGILQVVAGSQDTAGGSEGVGALVPKRTHLKRDFAGGNDNEMATTSTGRTHCVVQGDAIDKLVSQAPSQAVIESFKFQTEVSVGDKSSPASM